MPDCTDTAEVEDGNQDGTSTKRKPFASSFCVFVAIALWVDTFYLIQLCIPFEISLKVDSYFPSVIFIYIYTFLQSELIDKGFKLTENKGFKLNEMF